MKAIKIFFISLVLCGQLVGAQVNPNSTLCRHRMEPVVRIFELRDAVKGLNPFLKAVLSKSSNPACDSFVFLTNDHKHCSSETVFATVDTPPPEGVQAALPVGFISRGAAYLVKVSVYYTPPGTVFIYRGLEGYYGNNPELARFVNSLIQEHKKYPTRIPDFKAGSADSSRNEKLNQLLKGHKAAVELCDGEATWLYRKAIQSQLGDEKYIRLVKEEIFAGLCEKAYQLIRNQMHPNYISVCGKLVNYANKKACPNKLTQVLCLAKNDLLLSEPHLLFNSLCL